MFKDKQELPLFFTSSIKSLPKPIDVTQLVEIPSLQADASIDDIRTYLARPRKEIDYRTLYEAVPVVFFGEVHSDVPPKDEIIKHMSELKRAGVTHLAMEMFPKTLQVVIDRYCQSGKNRKVLLRHLQENWHLPEKYLAIVDAAKAEGIKVVALDVPKISKGMREIEEQNREWAKTIAITIAQHPNGKIAVYSGSGHIVSSPYVLSANRELYDKYHITSISVVLGGGKYPLPIEHASDIKDRIDALAPSLGLESEKFAVPITNNFAGARSADLYIHLPAEQ